MARRPPGTMDSMNISNRSAGERNALRVLVIDDEDMLREEVAATLERDGIDCVAAGCVDEARVVLARHPDIGVVISDIRMPGVDGLTFVRELQAGRDETAAIEVVVITGHASLADAERALRFRAFEFLHKPFQRDALLGVTRAALRSAAHRRAATAALAELGNENQRLEARALALEARLRVAMNRLLDQPGAEAGPHGAEGRFVRALKHELHTPLVPIIGFSELMARDPEHLPPTEVRAYAQLILAAGERLLAMFEIILDLQAMQYGVAGLELGQHDIAAVIRDAVAAAGPGDRRRPMIGEIAPATAWIDRDRVVRTCAEALRSALAAMPEGHPIVIGSRTTASAVEFLITSGATSRGAGGDLAYSECDLGLLRAVRTARAHGGMADETLLADGRRQLRIGLPLARPATALAPGPAPIDSGSGVAHDRNDGGDGFAGSGRGELPAA